MHPLDSVVIFNAPPMSGKDVAATHIDETIPKVTDIVTVPMMFKEHLYRLASVIYNLDYDVVVDYATDRSKKETPTDLFGGLSPRNAIIDISENVIKPRYGKRYFGNVCALNMMSVSNIITRQKLFVFSDGGFPDEAKPVIETVGEKNTLVIRIHREGYEYGSDSRRYMSEDMFEKPPTFIDIYNEEGKIDEFFQQCTSKVLEFINEKVKES